MITCIGIFMVILALISGGRWVRDGTAYHPSQILAYILSVVLTDSSYNIETKPLLKILLVCVSFWLGIYAIHWEYVNMWSHF